MLVDAGALTLDDGGEADGGISEGPDAGSKVSAESSTELDAGTNANLAAALEADAGEAPGVPWPDFGVPTGARFYGNLRSRLAIDTRFDSRPGDPLPENVAELQSWALLGGEAAITDRFKIVVEGKFRHRAVEERPPPGQPFLLVNGQNAKATFEAMPNEVYLDWYTPQADFRFGNQVMSFGANAQFAPADVLNPVDLREGLLFNDPSDVKLPVLAARARGELYGVNWMVAYVPFFVPDKFDLYGQDEALIQPYPGLNPVLPNLDRSVEDREQQSFIITQLPKDLPQYGDIAARLTTHVGPATLGVDYAYTREKLPEVIVDPELARFATEGPQAPFSDPATALSLSQRYGAGEKLLTGTFPRYQVGEVEGSALLGPVQLDADVGYSPERLYVDSKLNPVFHPTAVGTFTVADARGTNLTLLATVVVLWVFDIPQGEQLLLVDLPGAEAKEHNTIGAGVMAFAGYRFLNDQLEIEGRAFLDARQWSRAGGLKATWRFNDHVHGSLGGEYWDGPEASPLGYFRRNTNAYAEIRLDL